MSDDSGSGGGGDRRKVAALFERMGADAEQAERMATQLLKRAAQIARDEGISELEALERLLRRILQARDGGANGSENGLPE